MKRFLIITSAFFLCTSVFSAKVDTLTTFSAAMNKSIKTCVVIPDSYNPKGAALPVVYMLHGYSGNYSSWVKDFPHILTFADQYNMIIVGVDGAYSSWYFDSPVDPAFKYETYVSSELIAFIDKGFNTIKNKKGRAVCGLSMGGHGALYLAFRHQDIFGATGSMSGGVDILPFPENWDLSKRLGEKASNLKNWENNTVMNQLHLLRYNQIAIIIDCGINDFFYEVNKKLHEKLLYLNVHHDYIERPGGHDWKYWDNALYYQFLFFNRYFELK